MLGGLLGRLFGRGSGAAHLEVGRRGERDAARYLRSRGCRVVARDVRTPGGEADLVCLERVTGALVLVEVKARVRGVSPTAATSAVNADKRRRLVATARSLQGLRRFRGRPVRIDVVTVEYAERGGPPEIRHYPNAVTAGGGVR